MIGGQADYSRIAFSHSLKLSLRAFVESAVQTNQTSQPGEQFRQINLKFIAFPSRGIPIKGGDSQLEHERL